jgi:hypothetical protein
MQQTLTRTHAPLLAALVALGCATRGPSLVPDPTARSALWLATLKTVANLDSVSRGVMCLRLNHGRTTWNGADYRYPDSLLLEHAREQGLTVFPDSACRTPDGYRRTRLGAGVLTYEVIIQAGELISQGDNFYIQVSVFPVAGREGEQCRGTGHYGFTREGAVWKPLPATIKVVCM